MSCTEREKLFGYAQRLLEPREEHEVRAHLESCPTCRAAAEEYRKVDTLLEEWTPLEPSPSFDARVREAVEPSGASRSLLGLFGFPGLRWMAPALVTVLETMGGEEEVKLYQNLFMLEDYDLLAEFDLLSELPKGETKVDN